MTFQSVPEAIPVGVAAVLSGALAVFAWRRRARPTAPAFAAMMAGETVWALGATLEPLVVDLPLKRLCIDLRLLGTFAAILALLAFLFRYTGRSRWLEPRRFGAICAPALALLVLAWTDPWHHLFWARLANEEVGGAWIAIRTFGPGFWATLAYCYALAAVATALLALAVMRFTGVYRAQAAVMLFGVLLPWAVDVLDMNRVWGFVPIDFVSMSFAVTGLTFLPGLLRFRLLGLTPVAWAAVVERMHDAVVVIDHEGRVAVLNPAARRLIGRPDREVLGVKAALAFGDWAALAGRLERIGDRPGASLEIDRRGPDSSSVFHASISRLGDGGGEAGWVLVLRDVTELRRAERERERMASEQEARAQAEAANRAKDRFLAMLSHELRTPLTPVLLTVSAMLDDPRTPADFRPSLEMFRQNIGLEARLIDDLLDVMRTIRGKMSFHWDVVDAHALLGKALDICRSDIQDKRIRLTLDLAASEHHVRADAGRLQQVWWNLVKNAVKFTPEGGMIGLRTRDEDGRLVVEVTDTGIGIEPAALSKIFVAFEQVENSITRRYGGLGLGLAISKAIVEAHGGALTAASAGEGRGATFTVVLATVPAAEQPPRPIATAPAEPRALNILLVEDDAVTCRITAKLLRHAGHAVTTASSYDTALEVATPEFDLVVCDIGLPGRSGLDLMRELKARHGLVGVAVSGYGMEGDIERSREAGFVAHLTKPVDFATLVGMIQEATSGDRGEAGEGQVASFGHAAPPSI